jgi:hypothetical protein
VCLSQKEISIGELLEEAKIDANDLLKEVDTSKEKASQIPKEEKKETADADEPVSTPRPRLFKPKQGRPAFQKILQQKLQDQQKSESLLVNNNPEQSEGQVAPPRKRFRPTLAPVPASRFHSLFTKSSLRKSYFQLKIFCEKIILACKINDTCFINSRCHLM